MERSNLPHGVGSQGTHRNQECVLYGSVSAANKELLIQRLIGLCDPGRKILSEHEMVFTLKVAADASVPVQLRIRRRMNSDTNFWHFRYIGTLEPDTKCPTLVRKTVDSMMFSTNMMEFVKAMGLRMDYEMILEGLMFTKGIIRVIVCNLIYTEKTGHYDKSCRRNLLNNASCLVEVSAILPEKDNYLPAAKAVREFADQLAPLTDLQKFDYLAEPGI